MNRNPRAWGMVYGAVSVALCTGITVAGCSWAVSGTQKPTLPVPIEPAPVLAIRAEEPAISAADLWSDDRSRIETPPVSAELSAETQWEIFERCGQDAEMFCTVMAIAATESDFNSQKIGDDGDSIGMMQINTRWHTGRMEALGVTDLTDPIQCAVVAIDYLLELGGTLQTGPGDHALCIAYNCGPDSAKRKIQAGTSSTVYSETALSFYREYIAEMGVMVPNE